MAEGYLAKRLKEIGLKDISVISSGTGAFPGLKPTENTVEVMRRTGVDVSGYMSLALSKSHIQSADLILAMEPKHKEIIVSMIPEAEPKAYLLRKFARKDKKEDSIDDPIGMPLAFYEDIFEVIKDSIEGFLEWLKK